MRRAFALIVLAACDGGPAALDAGIDASAVELPACDLAFEHVYYAHRMELLPPDQGRDVDGDGTIDNLMGTLAVLLNPQLATAIAGGSVMALVIFPELQLPPPSEPFEMPMVWPSPVQDADSPPDPSNNADDGAFRADLSFLDASCQPRVPAIATQDGLTFTVAPTPGGFTAQNFGGIFDLQSAAAAGSVTADGAALEYDFTGAYTACGLGQVPAPNGVGSALGAITAIGLRPDIDLDGDGLEQLVLSGSAIIGCIDGDGTLIEDVSCACRPEIRDGFSAAVHVDAVPARITGSL